MEAPISSISRFATASANKSVGRFDISRETIIFATDDFDSFVVGEPAVSADLHPCTGKVDNDVRGVEVVGSHLSSARCTFEETW